MVGQSYISWDLIDPGLRSKIINHIISPIGQLDRVMGLLDSSKALIASLIKQLDRVTGLLNSSKVLVISLKEQLNKLIVLL